MPRGEVVRPVAVGEAGPSGGRGHVKAEQLSQDGGWEIAGQGKQCRMANWGGLEAMLAEPTTERVRGHVPPWKHAGEQPRHTRLAATQC